MPNRLNLDPQPAIGISLAAIPTSSTLVRALVLRIHGRCSRPDRTHQLNPPNGAAKEKRALRFDESRSLPTENPNVGIWGLLPQQRRPQPGGAPDLHLHDIMRGFAAGATDRERLLALGSDRELHQP